MVRQLIGFPVFRCTSIDIIAQSIDSKVFQLNTRQILSYQILPAGT